MRSRDKLKLLHFQYYSAYEHQIAIAKALADFLLHICRKIYYILLQLKYFIKNYDTLLSCYKRLSKNYHKWRQVLQIAAVLKNTT